MARKYACYHDAIKHILNVGEENKISLSQMMNDPDFGLLAEHKVLPEINKFIRREIRFLIEASGPCEVTKSAKLVEIKSEAGKEHFYFWSTAESRNEAISGEGISDNRFVARAIVYNFIKKNLTDCFPPSIMASLKKDLNNVDYDLTTDLNSKMQLISSGFNLSPKLSVSKSNLDHWDLAFSALQHEFVIRADYKTMNNLPKERVHLSPQRIQFVNQKVLLLCFVHEVGRVECYDVSNLTNVSKTLDYTYERVDQIEFEQEYDFEALVSKDVKEVLDDIFFDRDYVASLYADNVWKIKTTVKIVHSFTDNRLQPNTTALANFVTEFGASMEVITPTFLRAEMKRRADVLTQVYADNRQSEVAKTPKVSAGNFKKLKEIEELCNELLNGKKA